MNNLKRTQHNSGSILIWIIGVALLLFTGFRSVHLVSSTLPPEAQILGFAALAALDLGVLAWTFYATRGARGAQRTIAQLMVVVDLSGIAAAVIGDTWLIAGGNSGLVSTVAIWVLPVIVIANVGAVIATHLLDPDQAMRDAQRSLEEELHWQVAHGIQQNAAQVASGITPVAIQAKQAEMIAQFLAGVKGVPALPKSVPAPDYAAIVAALQAAGIGTSTTEPSKNGHGMTTLAVDGTDVPARKAGRAPKG